MQIEAGKFYPTTSGLIAGPFRFAWIGIYDHQKMVERWLADVEGVPHVYQADGRHGDPASGFPGHSNLDLQPLTSLKPLTFGYVNHHGEYAVRNAIPLRVEYRISEWHGDKPQHILVAWDVDKQAERDFLLADINVTGSKPAESTTSPNTDLGSIHVAYINGTLSMDEVCERIKAWVPSSLALMEGQGEGPTSRNQTPRRVKELLEANIALEQRARQAEEALFLFREFAIKNATQWQMGSSHHHPIWAHVAEVLAPNYTYTTLGNGPRWQFIQAGNTESIEALRHQAGKPNLVIDDLETVDQCDHRSTIGKTENGQTVSWCRDCGTQLAFEQAGEGDI